MDCREALSMTSVITRITHSAVLSKDVFDAGALHDQVELPGRLDNLIQLQQAIPRPSNVVLFQVLYYLPLPKNPKPLTNVVRSCLVYCIPSPENHNEPRRNHIGQGLLEESRSQVISEFRVGNFA